jgi:Phage tail assembly chaperone protein, TAC
MSLLPWPDLMRAAAQAGVTPAAFWALSVREWRALMGDAQGLDGGRLNELIAAFPDKSSQVNIDSPSPRGGGGGA